MIIDTVRTTGGQSVELGKITVLFGPNNAGKTQTLNDILSFIGGEDQHGELVIIDGVEYNVPETLQGWVDSISIGPASGNYVSISALSSQSMSSSWFRCNDSPRTTHRERRDAFY